MLCRLLMQATRREVKFYTHGNSSQSEHVCSIFRMCTKDTRQRIQNVYGKYEKLIFKNLKKYIRIQSAKVIPYRRQNERDAGIDVSCFSR